jgi:serine/threonine protein kinase
MGLEIGSTLLGYRVEGLLGRGGMGFVYKAEHLTLGRKVALKVLAPDLTGNQQFRTRFVLESRAAARLEHPSIIPIYEAGEADGLLYIAMRYVDGEDLGALIAGHGRLDAARALDLLDQVANALDAAHRQGMVHRDVKPPNVLVERRGGAAGPEHAWLCDFGLVKPFNVPEAERLTATGVFMGTIQYVAPEQIEGRVLDGRADVYALGCVLYECLTGLVPFERDNEVATLYAHLSDPPPTRAAFGDLPAGLDAVFARSMAKARDDRFATCAELIRAARVALAAGHQAPATVPAGHGAPPTAPASPPPTAPASPPPPTEPAWPPAAQPVARPAPPPVPSPPPARSAWSAGHKARDETPTRRLEQVPPPAPPPPAHPRRPVPTAPAREPRRRRGGGGGVLAVGVVLLLAAVAAGAFALGLVPGFGPEGRGGGIACVNRFTEPPPGSAVRRQPLDALRRGMGVDGQFVVAEMRLFEGSDGTRWWYVKANQQADEAFRARWLLRGEAGGPRIVAAAPYDSTGFSSPDWRGFRGTAQREPYPDLPGEWAGPDYDYVAEGELPADVQGCLRGS